MHTASIDRSEFGCVIWRFIDEFSHEEAVIFSTQPRGRVSGLDMNARLADNFPGVGYDAIRD